MRAADSEASGLRGEPTMSSVLILSLDIASGALLGRLVEEAGYLPTLVQAGESPLSALERTGARVVLLDAERTVASTFIAAARRLGASVVIFSTELSAYELAASARRNGMSHFPLHGSPEALRALLDAAVALRQPGAVSED